MNPTPASSSPLSFLGSILGSPRTSRRLGLALPLLPALLILLQPAPAIAGADWWTNNLATNNLSNASTLWVTAATGGTATSPVSGDSWIFANTGDSVLNNNFSNAFTVAGITFNAGTGANTINGNSINLAGVINNNSSSLQTFNTDFVLTGASRTISNTSGGNLVFNGVISGTNGLTISGAGTTTFTAANTYSGMTGIGANTNLVLGNSLALQNSILNAAGGVNVLWGIGGVGMTNFTLGGLIAGGGGNIVLTNRAGNGIALTLNNSINNSTTFGGTLSGANASLTKTGAGVQTFYGNNTYSGVTRVNEGALSLLSTNSLYRGTNSRWTAANITVASNATIGVGFNNFGSSNVFSLLSTLAAATGNTNGLQDGAVFGFDTTRIDLGASNIIVTNNLGNSANGSLGYAVLGSGTLSLIGNNTYTGNTWIYGGTLLYGAGLNSIRAAGLSGTLLLTNTTTISNAIDVSSVLTQNNGGFNVTSTGLLSGSGTLTVTGNGTTTLNPGLGNTNTLRVFYQTGGTVVLTNGTLNLTSTANGGNSGFVLGRGTAFINEGTTLISGGGTNISEAIIGRDGSGTLTMNGGFWTNSGSINIGYGSLAGGSVLNMGGGTITARTINIGVNSTNTLNLNGGLIIVGNLANAQSNAASVINFNGGMIRASTNTASFIAPAIATARMTNNNILAGGLVFDTAGFAVGITNDLLGSSGDGGLKLTNSTGNGTLTLSGSNSYNGGTVINSGTLLLGNTNALGATNGSLNIAAGTLNAAAFNIQVGAVSLGNGTITGSGTLTGTSYTTTNTAAATISEALAGSGAFTQNGTGTTTLTASNTYSGGTVLNAGILAISNNAALGTGTVTFASNATVAGLANLTITNNYSIASGVNATFIQTASTALTNSGIISGEGTLSQSGAGTLSLTKANTYSGGTRVNSGTLVISNKDALGSGQITLTGGTLNLGGLTTVTNTLGVVTGGTLSNGTITNTGGNYIFDNTGAVTVSAVLAGANGLIQRGAGTTTLSAANTYTGGTVLNSGTLAINNNAAFGTGTVTFASNATVAGLANLTITNNFGIASGVNATFAQSTGTFLNINGVISGSGSLTQNGPGTLYLRGSNSYTGSTVISGGTLALVGSSFLSTNSAIINNATLRFENAANIAQGVNFSTSISGTGSVNQANTATTTLNGTNTYAGVSRIDSGALNFLNTAALYGGSNSLWTAGNIIVASNATVAFGVTNFGNDNIQTLLSTLSSATGNTNGLRAGAFFGFDTTGTNYSVTNNLSNSANGTLGFANLGSGTLTLVGTNTYTGVSRSIGGVGNTLNFFTTSSLYNGDTNSWTANNIIALNRSGVAFGVANFGNDNIQTLLSRLTATTGTGSTNGLTGLSSFGFDVTGTNYTLTNQLSGTAAGSVWTNAQGSALGLAVLGDGTLTLGGNKNWVAGLYGNGNLNIGTNMFYVNKDVGPQVFTGQITGTSGGEFISAWGGNSLTFAPGAGKTNSVGFWNVGGAGSTIVSSGVFNIANNLTLDWNRGGETTLLINGGTVNTTGEVRNGGGIINVTSGSLVVNGNFYNAFSYGGTQSNAAINLSGTGTITAKSGITVNQGQRRGTLNLNGGTLNVLNLWGGGAQGVVNFNGSTVSSTTNSANFTFTSNATSTNTYNVLAGGAIFNLGGYNGTNYNIGIAANLINGYTNTLTDGGLTLTNSSTGGGGTLTLSGANSYNGVTTINGGTLAIGAVNAIATNNAVVVNSRGTLQLNASQTLASLTGSGSVVFNGGDLILDIASNTNQIISGNISGASSLNGIVVTNSIGAAGTLTLSGSNSFSYGMSIYKGGTVVAGSSNAFGNNSSFGGIYLVNGTIDVSSYNVNAEGEGGIILGNGTITASGGGTLTASKFTAFSGYNTDLLSISASLAGVGATFRQEGSGTTVLSGSNSFTGVTTVTAGTLVLSNSFGLGGSTFDSSGLASGGTLVFGTNSSAFTFGGLQGTDSLALTNELGQALALTVGANNTNTTFSGALTDGGLGGSLTKSGTGTLSLSGANNYTGTTTINGGTLALGTGATLSTNSAIAVNGNFAFTGTDNQTQGVTFSTNISGTGTITQSGTGTTTLSPGIGITNTIGSLIVTSGTVNITNGILDLTKGTNSYMVARDAILDVNGNGTIISSSLFNAINGTVNVNSGGSITNRGSFPTVNGTLNVNGGTFNAVSELLISWNTAGGVVNLNSGQMNLLYVGMGQTVGQASTLNLNGGTLRLAGVNFNGRGNTNGIVNFNGSTVQMYNGSQNWGTNFFGTNSTYNVLTGGAIFDVAGYTITNNAPLLSGTNNDGGVTLMNSSATAASLTMRGVNTYVGNTTIGTNATLVIGGAGSLGSGNYAGNISIAGTNSTFNFASTANQSFTGLISGNGTFIQSGAGTTTLNPGGNTNTLGRFTQTGGTVVLTTGTLITTITNNANNSGFQVSRGTAIINEGTTLISGGGNTGSEALIGSAGSGTLTMNGGSWTHSGTISLGYGLNSGRSSVLNMGGGTITARQIQMGVGSSNNTLNLNGGVVVVEGFVNNQNNASGVINFNGGMIRASTNTTSFIAVSTGTNSTITNNILERGLVFDTAGFAVRITNNLLGSAGDGGLSLTNSTGNGTLTLSGSNSYTGGTTINGGTLLANHQLALAGGNVTVNNGSTLLLSNIDQIVGNVTLGNGTISGSGTLTGTSYTATNSLNASISESLAGSGTLTMNGAGTLTLSGSNSSYSGGTLLNSGAINITTAKALGNGDLTMAGGNLGYNGLTSTSIDNQINVNSATATIANLTGNSANTLTLNGGINLNSNALTLSGGSFVAAGNISGSQGSLGLSNATATLSGNNTYGGTTTLLGGSTLNLGVANGISTLSAVTLGGVSDTSSQTNTLNLSGFNQSLASLNSTSNSYNQVVNNSETLATLTLTGNSSFAGSLNGNNLGLTVSAGSGNVVNITGSESSFTGQTLVQTGSLNLGSGTKLTAASSVVVENGATLLLSGNNNIHSGAPLTLDGGTLSMGGQGVGGIRASAQTFASLTLTANSTIDFSSLSGNSDLTFNTIVMDGFELFVFNWSSNVTRLFDNSTSSLSASDLSRISFFSDSGTTFLGTGGFSGTEIVPVPEPGVIMAAALLLGWLLFANRGVLINLISRRRSA